MLLRVLLAMPARPLRAQLERLLRRGGLVPVVLTGRLTLWARLAHEDYDFVLVSDPHLPEHPEDFVASIRSLPERPEVIVFRQKEDPQERAALLEAGCLAVLWQGLPDEAIAQTVAAVIARQGEGVKHWLRADRLGERPSLSDFVSASPAMQQFMLIARRIAPTDSTVLLLGETGVGKGRLARAIHTEGPRAEGPFVAVNCGALPEGVLESELFGHEEGAFTGATRSRRGYFEMAHKGSIFLDEIGEMPSHVQVKLLRVLEQKRLVRVGGEHPVRIDVRVMAATNRNLEEEIQAKRFRLDLYYRLAVITLTIPPLRDRREDIPQLVDSYLQHFSTVFHRTVTSVSARASDALVRYSWPGNVREVINVLERAVLLCKGSEIDLPDLPQTLVAPGRRPPAGRESRPERAGHAGDIDQPFSQARRALLDRFERAYLEALLQKCGGRVGEAARQSNLNERSLYALMRRHGIQKEAFKGPPKGVLPS